MTSLLDDLNNAQREAVATTDGPLLVLAGAGSGKTRVITRRAAYLASTVTGPRHVLAITFTNKAAGEMRDRMEELGFGREMTVCTFHSLGARLLRWFAPQAGLQPNFTIFDQADRRQVVKQAITDAGLSTTNWSPAMVEATISDAKNDLKTPETFVESAQGARFQDQALARIFAVYEQLMEQQQALDFDDLLLKSAFLLGKHPEIRDRLEDRFRYVLIDEYQDTNHSQYMIARGLTLTHENICATGDPDQSIYAWRGANIRNIMEFEQDFPNAKVVRLEQNYRSTKRILSAASSLINSNVHRKAKSLWTTNPEGTPIRIVERETPVDEADYLVEEIAQHVESGGALSEIGVFYRVNALTRVIEEAFIRAGISYQIARGTEFYNRKEIKDLLAYLRVLVNPADEIALLRSINTPARGIGKTSLGRVAAYAQEHNLRFFDAARQAEKIPALKRAARKIKGYVDLIEQMHSAMGKPAGAIVQEVFTRSGLEAELRKQASGDREPLENVEELISAATDYVQKNPDDTFTDWLGQISLVSDADAVDRGAGAVTLMTLHAAKGLEFPIVYVIAVEDGLLPHQNCKEDPTQLEEERRLCFVGMTRAQQQLTLTYAKWRSQRGMTSRTSVSQFLGELPQDEIEWHRAEAEESSDDQADRQRKPQGDYDAWRKGMYLRHPAFGVGRLLWKQVGGGFTRAGVRFPSHGEKTLILEYAKMTPLDPDECQLQG